MRTRFVLIVVTVLAAVAPAGRAEEGRKTMLDRIPTGEFWYAMMEEGRRPMGYARLVIARTEEGGLTVDWELRLAMEAGTYEETRAMGLDRHGELVASDYRAFGNLVCAGKRTGDDWLVTTIEDGKPVTKGEPRPEGAMTGMGFVFASAVPREEGGRLSRLELDEANAFTPIGETTFTRTRKLERDWEGERIAVHEIRLEKANGKTMPIQVADDGRIIQSDWGGGNVMILSKTSTKELFRPAPPVVSVVETPPDRLEMRGELPGFSPEEVYDHFTVPSLLVTFWAPKAEIEAKPGGKYHLTWPDMGWKLRGVVREAEPGRKLAFTWNWEHTPDAPELLVTMTFADRTGGGTVVTIAHGPYEDTPEGRQEREGHEKGWQHFFARLRALR